MTANRAVQQQQRCSATAMHDGTANDDDGDGGDGDDDGRCRSVG